MTDVQDLKAALRKDAFARRKEAHLAGEESGQAANERLHKLLGANPGVVIAGYRPIRTEIDPTWAMTRQYAQGARLCVPVIEDAGQPLLFREWSLDSEMVEGPFGAEVPARGDWLEPQIIIAPLVAWDRRGGRLGYGGGFYDRTLALMRTNRAVVAIGFAFGAQEVASVPVSAVDQRMDRIVTEHEVVEVNG